MNKKSRNIIIGGVGGALILALAIGLCAGSTFWTVIGAGIGLMLAISATQMEKERETGLNS